MTALAMGGTPSVRERVRAYMDKAGINYTQLTARTSYSRSTISQYLNDKYDSDATKLEEELLRCIDEDTAPAADAAPAQGAAPMMALPIRKSFYASTDARSIVGVCERCQSDMALGIIVGRTGYGKTYTLKQYAKTAKVAYMECDDTMSSRDLVDAMERVLGIPSGTGGTIWRHVNGIRDYLNTNPGYLIIIDEADKLVSKYTQKKMEILRAIYDQADVGLVIAGEPKLEIQIRSYLTRFANRVDFYTSLRGLQASEVADYLEGYDIDEDALAELKARACNMQTGCFRLLDRTLNNVTRLLREADDTRITVDIIKRASSMMML